MKALVCDTGPLMAVLDDRDKHDAASVALFDGFAGAPIVPSLIVTEVCRLAQNHVGPQAEARFLDSVVARADHRPQARWRGRWRLGVQERGVATSAFSRMPIASGTRTATEK